MDLDETRAFLAVLEHGSFKAAAETLNQPRATLRRRVESLEARAGTSLLTRSRHGVEVTPAGRRLAGHARTLLREADVLFASLRDGDEAVGGRISIGVPANLAGEDLARMFGSLRAAHPQLRVEIDVFDPSVGRCEQFDLALVLGGDSLGLRWTRYPLAEVREGLFASVEYLERRGTPTSLTDLADHELLVEAGGERESWPLHAGGEVAITAAVVAGGGQHLRQFAVHGHGVALLTDLGLGSTELAESTPLRPVLADQVGRRSSLSLLVPTSVSETSNPRAVVEHLREWFRQAPRRRTGRLSAV